MKAKQQRDLSFALASLALSGSGAISVPAAPITPALPRRTFLLITTAGFMVAAVLAGALASRNPSPEGWSGTMLGGPEIAIRPRVSLDGRIVAFQAMVKGLTQLAVMTPECTLYNDRVTDVP